MEDLVPLLALGITFVAVYGAQGLARREGRSRMGRMWAAAILGTIPVLILASLPSKLPFEQTSRS
jgi:hypothetical protein